MRIIRNLGALLFVAPMVLSGGFSVVSQTAVGLQVVWNPDETRIALVIASSENIEIWQTDTDPVILEQTLKRHEAEVTAVRWSPDGTMFASIDAQGQIIIWDADSWLPAVTMIEEGTFQGGEALTSLAWDPSSSYVAVGNASGTFAVYKADSGIVHGGMFAHVDKVTAVEWTSDGAYILTSGRDSSVLVWDAITYDLVQKMVENENMWINDIALNSKGFQVATANGDGSVSIWDPLTANKLAQFQAQPDELSGVSAIDWSADGKYLVTVGGDNHIRFWNAATSGYDLVYELEVDAPLYAVDFGPLSNHTAIFEDDLLIPDIELPTN